MPLNRRLVAAFASAVGLLAAASGAEQDYDRDDPLLDPAPRTITHDTVDEGALEVPFPWLDRDQVDRFMHGRNVFRASWVVAGPTRPPFSGLGPFYNRSACSSCHHRNGRGSPPSNEAERLLSMVVRLDAGSGGDNPSRPHATYGAVLQYQATAGVPIEGHLRVHYEAVERTLPDGTLFVLRRPHYSLYELGYGALEGEASLSPRIAAAIVGPGLIQAVPDQVIAALADPDDVDGDGISGRVNMVLDRERDSLQPGRFGWKAEHPTIRQFAAAALAEDIGITSPVYPEPNCTTVYTAFERCAAAGDRPAPEAGDAILNALEAYLSLLAVPAPRFDGDPEAMAGRAIFRQIGCDGCHVPELESRPNSNFLRLSSQPIGLYSDLLLHDMGEGLEDQRGGRPVGNREWRTAPLWGIGLAETVNGNAAFLHDGRARTLEEAILWHGGEADRTRAAYEGLLAGQRRQLIAFLEAL